MAHYRTDQAINKAYPVEQDFPLTGHIEITANIKRHINVKGIVFQKSIVKGIIKLHQLYLDQASMSESTFIEFLP